MSNSEDEDLEEMADLLGREESETIDFSLEEVQLGDVRKRRRRIVVITTAVMLLGLSLCALGMVQSPESDASLFQAFSWRNFLFGNNSVESDASTPWNSNSSFNAINPSTNSHDPLNSSNAYSPWPSETNPSRPSTPGQRDSTFSVNKTTWRLGEPGTTQLDPQIHNDSVLSLPAVCSTWSKRFHAQWPADALHVSISQVRKPWTDSSFRLAENQDSAEPGQPFVLEPLTIKEARTCLARERFLLIGDSLMRNLYVGMIDLLNGEKSDAYLSPRTIKNRWHVDKRRLSDVYVPLEGPNYQPSVGRNISLITDNYSFLLFAKELKEILRSPAAQSASIIVFGIVRHDVQQASIVNYRNKLKQLHPEYLGARLSDFYKRLPSLASKVMDELLDVPGIREKLVWITGPPFTEKGYARTESLALEKMQRLSEEDKLRFDVNRALAHMAVQKGIPVVNAFDFQQGCWNAQYCRGDAEHHGRRVNRLKATLVLSLLCNCPISSRNVN